MLCGNLALFSQHGVKVCKAPASKGRLLLTDVCVEAGPGPVGNDVGGCLPRLADWTEKPMSPHAHVGTLA